MKRRDLTDPLHWRNWMRFWLAMAVLSAVLAVVDVRRHSYVWAAAQAGFVILQLGMARSSRLTQRLWERNAAIDAALDADLRALFHDIEQHADHRLN